MKGKKIEVRRSDWINDGRVIFTLTLTGATIFDGKLQLSANMRRVGSNSSVPIKALLTSTMARSSNPWPGANSPSARSRDSTKKEKSEAEINEQTQSLYSSAEAGTGCELVFLNIPYPTRGSMLQVGVVLARRDNDLGIQINKSLCEVIRMLNKNENADQALAGLNRTISN